MVASSQQLEPGRQKSAGAQGGRLQFFGGVFLGAFLGLASAVWLSQYAHFSTGPMLPRVGVLADAPLIGVSPVSDEGADTLAARGAAVGLDLMADADRSFLRRLYDAGFAVVPAYGIPEAWGPSSSASATGMSYQ
jgi:hypothetical protein